MYVNMHELANLAASRAQEMQLPLPPPPASLSAPGTEKVRQQHLTFCNYKCLAKYIFRLKLRKKMVEVKHQNLVLNLAVDMEVKLLYRILIHFIIQLKMHGMYLVLYLL